MELVSVLRWEGKQQGIQCRACPVAAVQLCLVMLCTINLNKETACVKTLALLIKCFTPQEWRVIICSRSPEDTELFESSGVLGIKSC